jgi:hypothetical protein
MLNYSNSRPPVIVRDVALQPCFKEYEKEEE